MHSAVVSNHVYYNVWCDGCKCETLGAFTEEEAANNWNTRAQSAEVERLRALASKTLSTWEDYECAYGNANWQEMAAFKASLKELKVALEGGK